MQTLTRSPKCCTNKSVDSANGKPNERIRNFSNTHSLKNKHPHEFTPLELKKTLWNVIKRHLLHHLCSVRGREGGRAGRGRGVGRWWGRGHYKLWNRSSGASSSTLKRNNLVHRQFCRVAWLLTQTWRMKKSYTWRATVWIMWRSAWFSSMSAEGGVIGQEGSGAGSQSGRGRVGTRLVRVIFTALLIIIIIVVLFIPTAEPLENFPLVALPAPAAVRVLLLPVTCSNTRAIRQVENSLHPFHLIS